MEFARWVHETAPKQLILRIDITRFSNHEEIDAVMVSNFYDDEGRHYGMYYFHLGYPWTLDTMWHHPAQLRYHGWDYGPFRDHSIWHERCGTGSWNWFWKRQEPVICRVRSAFPLPSKERQPWRSVAPHHRRTLIYASQLLGMVRQLSGSEPNEPFVHAKTVERLEALIRRGDREHERLSA